MSRKISLMVTREFSLRDDGQRIMEKNIKFLDKSERVYYLQRIKPLEKEIKQFLSDYYSGGNVALKEQVVHDTVNSMLEKKGDPDLADSMMMDVIGRIKVYNQLRQRSEKEGLRLSALTNFGGLSMLLMTVVAVAAIVLYILNM